MDKKELEVLFWGVLGTILVLIFVPLVYLPVVVVVCLLVGIWFLCANKK